MRGKNSLIYWNVQNDVEENHKEAKEMLNIFILQQIMYNLSYKKIQISFWERKKIFFIISILSSSTQ